MSFIKKNCTIVVLVAIIISSLAVSLLAAPTIFDETSRTGITIQTKRCTGAYPQAIEVVLDTISDTVIHYDYVWALCQECDVSVWAYSDSGAALDPTRARIVCEFPWSFFSQDHYKVLFRVCD